MADQLRLGLIGTGKLGTAIGGRLIDCGFDITAWNRTLARTETLAALGASVAETPALEQSDLIVVCLADPKAVLDVIPRIAATGKLILDTSTVDPATSREEARIIESEGGRFMDTPVGGSSEVAEAGELVVMAGGDFLEEARPVLDAIGAEIIHCGGVGTGSAAKLTLNALLGLTMHAVAEAYALGISLNLDPGLVLDLLETSPAGAQVAKKRGRIESGEYEPSFRLVLMLKDITLAIEAAGAAPTGALSAAKATLEDAVEAGLGELDYSAITKLT